MIGASCKVISLEGRGRAKRALTSSGKARKQECQMVLAKRTTILACLFDSSDRLPKSEIRNPTSDFRLPTSDEATVHQKK